MSFEHDYGKCKTPSSRKSLSGRTKKVCRGRALSLRSICRSCENGLSLLTRSLAKWCQGIRTIGRRSLRYHRNHPLQVIDVHMIPVDENKFISGVEWELALYVILTFRSHISQGIPWGPGVKPRFVPWKTSAYFSIVKSIRRVSSSTCGIATR